MARYTYYTDGKRKVICVSHYAGVPVRGVAVCSEKDKFNEEFGKELARAKVDERIAEKKFRKITAAVDDTWELYQKIKKEHYRLIMKLTKQEIEFKEAQDKVNALIAQTYEN